MSELEKLDIGKLEEAATVLKALAHPVRIAIVGLLDNTKLPVTDIYEKLNIDQPTASHHLNILKSKGILLSERKGRQIYYFLKYDMLLNILSCVNQCSH